MSEAKAMLEAHVQFELARWSGAELTATVHDEVVALLAWLADVTVADVLDHTAVEQLTLDVMCTLEPSDYILESVVDAVVWRHESLTADHTRLSELVPRADFDRLAEAVVGLEDVRAEMILQVTTSEVYSQLMSYVLYQGIKNYLQSENVIAKRVPGAAALMRFGHSAVSAAAPKLEHNVDRQLASFVNANISDTIHESREFLNAALDKEVLDSVADEIWQANSDSTVGESLGLISSESMAALIRAAWAVIASVRSSPVVADVAAQACSDFFEAHGETKVLELLDEVGVTHDRIMSWSAELAAPAIARAVQDGFAEARIRARLEPFYAAYFGTDPASG